MSLQTFDDAQWRCCWVENDGERCDKSPVHGSTRQSLCAEHAQKHRALTQEPDAAPEAPS